MTIHDKIRDKKLGYDINSDPAISTIPALSSCKIDKYEYLTGKEILPSDQSRMIEQAQFTYSPLGKALQQQTKITEGQGGKKTDAIIN